MIMLTLAEFLHLYHGQKISKTSGCEISPLQKRKGWLQNQKPAPNKGQPSVALGNNHPDISPFSQFDPQHLHTHIDPLNYTQTQ